MKDKLPKYILLILYLGSFPLTPHLDTRPVYVHEQLTTSPYNCIAVKPGIHTCIPYLHLITSAFYSTTDSLLFQTQMSDQNLLLCGGELHENLFLILSFLHILIPSWQLTVSTLQIGSLICIQHDKLMVKMTILFFL